jgi:hypothetical protein
VSGWACFTTSLDSNRLHFRDSLADCRNDKEEQKRTRTARSDNDECPLFAVVDGKLSTFLQPAGRSNGLCFDSKIERARSSTRNCGAKDVTRGFVLVVVMSVRVQ